MTAIRNSFYNLLTTLIIYPIGFISSVLVTRILGPEERGIYVFLLLLLSFSLPIFSFGFGSGITYFVSSKKYDPKEIAFSIVLSGFITALLIDIVILFLWNYDFLGKTAQRVELFELTLILISIICYTIYFYLSRILLGDSEYSTLNILNICQGLTSPVTLFMLVVIFGLKIRGAIFNVLLLNSLLCTYMVFQIFKKYRPIYTLKICFIKECSTYGIKGWIGDMVGRANLRFDQIILGYFSNAASLGIYSVSVLMVELIWLLPDAIGPVLFNKIAQEKSIEEKVKLTYKMNRILLFISIILAIPFSILTYFLILPYAYGQKFIYASSPFLIMLPGSILFIIHKVVTKFLGGSGYILEVSKGMAYGSIVSIILYILLIPKFDLIGAALASSIGYIAVSISCMYQYNKIHPINYKEFFFIKLEDLLEILTIGRSFLNKKKY